MAAEPCGAHRVCGGGSLRSQWQQEQYFGSLMRRNLEATYLSRTPLSRGLPAPPQMYVVLQMDVLAEPFKMGFPGHTLPSGLPCKAVRCLASLKGSPCLKGSVAQGPFALLTGYWFPTSSQVLRAVSRRSGSGPVCKGGATRGSL